MAPFHCWVSLDAGSLGWHSTSMLDFQISNWEFHYKFLLTLTIISHPFGHFFVAAYAFSLSDFHFFSGKLPFVGGRRARSLTVYLLLHSELQGELRLVVLSFSVPTF